MDDDQEVDSKTTSPSGVVDEDLDMDEASMGEGEDEEDADPISPNVESLSGSAMSVDQSDQPELSPNQNPPHAHPSEVPSASHVSLKHSRVSGKPLSIRRGPGRPRKEKPTPRRKGSGSLKLKKWRTNVYMRGLSKSLLLKDDGRDLDDPDRPSKSPTPTGEDDGDHLGESGETGENSAIAGNSKLDKVPNPEEPPYFPEQWSGKVCALCNLGERTQLGQGELMQLSCPEGFTPLKTSPKDNQRGEVDLLSPRNDEGPERESLGTFGDKSPRGGGPAAVTIRRQKSMAKCKNPSQPFYVEPVDELSVVGFVDEPEVGVLFEPSGHFYVHHSCALWSSGVTRSEDVGLQNVGQAVLQGSSRRCSYCGHFGATIPCIVTSCQKYLHFPCAAASGAFQDCKSISMVCNQHLDQVPLLLSGEISCMSCFALGDVSNLTMCTMCGHHYHGGCIGLALLPGVRAGWQCTDCRVCQVCRQTEDVSKVMLCETCDKAYHPQCLRPIVTSIPKYGWKCKV